MRNLLRRTFWLVELLASPIILVAAIVLRVARRPDPKWTPISRKIFDLVGVYPIKNHYYEPYIDTEIRRVLGKKRALPGICVNRESQIEILNAIANASNTTGFKNLSRKSFPAGKAFCPFNRMFGLSDAEFYYGFLRLKKPKKIYEVGSGVSTLVALGAIEDIAAADEQYACSLTCIEPYESKWLEKMPVKVIRHKVEDVPKTLFQELEPGDLLFIDSSHIIRHSGDVLAEYLEIIPSLGSGVLIHIHDIFTPYNYPEEWILEHRYFWNEQYILEALLTMNSKIKIIAATHYLSREFTELWSQACPNHGIEGISKSLYLETV